MTTLRTGKGDQTDGFAFVGRFSRCEGKVEQRVAMISLPGAPVIYVEQLRAATEVDVKEVATGIIAILNEDAKPLTRNERVVWTAAGREVMRGASAEAAERHTWKTSWANLDDRIGLVARASGRMAYSETHAYQRARLQQELVANYLAEVGPRRSGEIISRAVLGILPGARYTHQLDLRVEPLGDGGVAVLFERWLVAVNLSEAQVTGEAFGNTLKLAPQGVTVQRLR